MRMHALAAITLSALVACPSQQQQPISAPGGLATVPASEAPSYLAGQWRVAETNEEKAQRLRAIDAATEHLGRFQRGMARERLAERTAPPGNLSIEFAGPRVTISSDGTGVELELGSPPVEVSGDQGNGRLNATLDDEQLVVVAQSGDGVRTATYFASVNQLTLEVAMSVEKLHESLNYASTYVRVTSTMRRQDRVLSAPLEGGIHAEGK